MEARAAARLARQVDVALQSVGLSVPQYRLLSLLAEGPAGGSLLAANLAVSKPSVTALADGLMARQLVDRHPDPSDRRRISYLLTPAGAALLAEGDRVVQERLARIASHVEDGDGELAMAGLSAWHRALDCFRQAVGAAR